MYICTTTDSDQYYCRHLYMQKYLYNSCILLYRSTEAYLCVYIYGVVSLSLNIGLCKIIYMFIYLRAPSYIVMYTYSYIVLFNKIFVYAWYRMVSIYKQNFSDLHSSVCIVNSKNKGAHVKHCIKIRKHEFQSVLTWLHNF